MTYIQCVGCTFDFGKYIIRKTKRFEKTKRSDVFRKTKCSFFDFPTRNLKRLRRLWGVLSFLIIAVR